MAKSGSRVWLITGANSGLGLMLSQLALSKGDTVIATTRSLSKIPEDLRSHAKADVVEMEMTAHEAEIRQLIDAKVAKHGRIDVLVNNAGFGHLGNVEETSEEQARYQFDVNYFAVFNFTRAVVPHMRKQGSGVIVQVSSGWGFAAEPGWSSYSASKFAMEGLSEALAGEVAPFGIRVHLIEPGVFRTNFVKPILDGHNVSHSVDGYQHSDVRSLLPSFHGSQRGDPEKAAERMYEIATETGMGAGLAKQLRIMLGADAYSIFQKKVAILEETYKKCKDIATSTDYSVSA